eukprot:scaffold10956_cov57-Isochrysis_galbana.AAC.2
MHAHPRRSPPRQPRPLTPQSATHLTPPAAGLFFSSPKNRLAPYLCAHRRVPFPSRFPPVRIRPPLFDVLQAPDGARPQGAKGARGRRQR